MPRSLLALLICAGCQGSADPPPPTAPRVQVLDRDAVESLQLAEGCELKLPVAGNEWVRDLAPGDVLASEYGPAGMLRKVESVVENDGVFEICASQAALTDAIEDGEVRARLDARRSGTRRHGQSTGDDFGAQIDISEVLYEDDEFRIAIADGHLSWEPTLDLAFDIARRRLSRFEAIATGRLEFVFRVEASGQTPGLSEERKLWESPPVKFVQFIGPVPVVEIVQLEVYAGFEVDGFGATVEAGALAGAEVSAGVVYQDGRWSEVAEQGFSFEPIGPTLDVDSSLDLRAYLRPELKVLFYGVAGPTLSLEPYASLDLDIAGPNWELGAGLIGRVGGEVDLLGLVDAQIEATLFDDLYWPLLSSPHCGEGLCTPGENPASCPADCASGECDLGTTEDCQSSCGTGTTTCGLDATWGPCEGPYRLPSAESHRVSVWSFWPDRRYPGSTQAGVETGTEPHLWTALARFDLPGGTLLSCSLRTTCGHVTGATTTVQISEVLDNWDPATVSWDLFPTTGSAFGQFVVSDSATTHTTDITPLCEQWLAGPNHGMNLTAQTGDKWVDCLNPVLLVDYESGCAP